MLHFFLDLKLTPGGKLLLSPLLLKPKTPADFQHQSGKVRKEGFEMEKSKVYFTKNITPEAMIQMYEALGLRLRKWLLRSIPVKWATRILSARNSCSRSSIM